MFQRFNVPMFSILSTLSFHLYASVSFLLIRLIFRAPEFIEKLPFHHLTQKNHTIINSSGIAKRLPVMAALGANIRK